MNICMITSSYPRHEGDGAGSYVRGLAEALVSRGHTVHVVAPHDPAVAPMVTSGVDVHRFRYAPRESLHFLGHGSALVADVRLKGAAPLLLPGYAIAAVARSLAVHRQQPFDLIHAHWAVPGGVIGALVARAIGRPLVTTLHGSDVYVIERSRPYAAAARLGFRTAGSVTAVCEDLRARAVRVGLNGERSLVVPCGVDTARYGQGRGETMRSRLGLSGEAPVIGALGRLVYKKGFSFLISAMPRILEHVPDAHCVIGGDGDLREELTSLARKAGVAHRVLLPGHIAWHETPDFYAMCDVVAVPSVLDTKGNVDGLPNVMLEAMASRRAVVGSRIAGIPDIIEDGWTGLLVPPGDADSLASAVVRLLADAPFRRKIAERARDHVAAHHEWDMIAEQMEGVYRTAQERFGSRVRHTHPTARAQGGPS